MLIRNYDRRNRVANILRVGGLAFILTSFVCLGGFAFSRSNIKGKLESLARYKEHSRQIYKQNLKDNDTSAYVISVFGLLSAVSIALGDGLYRRD